MLFDGLVLPDGVDGVTTLGGHVEVMDFISNQFRHGKTLLAIGAAKALLERAGAGASLASGEPDLASSSVPPPRPNTPRRSSLPHWAEHRHPEREAGALVP